MALSVFDILIIPSRSAIDCSARFRMSKRRFRSLGGSPDGSRFFPVDFVIDIHHVDNRVNGQCYACGAGAGSGCCCN